MNFSIQLSVVLVAVAVTFGSLYGGDDLTVTVFPLQEVYCPEDTVVVAIKVIIPPSQYLCGNPLGPGVGRALKITLESSGPDICWMEIKKEKARKYGSSIGDWVWAYKNEVFFFCTGVVSSYDTLCSREYTGSILFEGLLCRTSCRIVKKTLPFSIAIGKIRETTGQSDINGELEARFRCAQPMVYLNHDSCGVSTTQSPEE